MGEVLTTRCVLLSFHNDAVVWGHILFPLYSFCAERSDVHTSSYGELTASPSCGCLEWSGRASGPLHTSLAPTFTHGGLREHGWHRHKVAGAATELCKRGLTAHAETHPPPSPLLALPWALLLLLVRAFSCSCLLGAESLVKKF